MIRVALVMVFGALISGCSSLNGPLDGALGGDSEGAAGSEVEVIEVSEIESVSAGSAAAGEHIEGEHLAVGQTGMQTTEVPMNSYGTATAGMEPPSQRLFFFGFDSSSINAEDLAAVQAHALYLLSNPVMIVRLEGHADERGSREYNLALGERRAQTMSDLLVAEGVSPGQIEIISYGEEKPLEAGHEEAFWAQNRRVELSYPQ